MLYVLPELSRGEADTVSRITSFPHSSVTCQQTNSWGHPSHQRSSPELMGDWLFLLLAKQKYVADV